MTPTVKVLMIKKTINKFFREEKKEERWYIATPNNKKYKFKQETLNKTTTDSRRNHTMKSHDDSFHLPPVSLNTRAYNYGTVKQ